MTEYDRRWIATMFAADAQFDIAAPGSTLLTTHLHKLTNPILIEGDEGIFIEEPGVHVEG
jgi:hypothetical protein